MKPGSEASLFRRRLSREIKPLDLTQGEVRELLELRGGELFWKVDHKSAKAGDLAGGPQTNGYWRIKIHGRTYKRSRLVWLLVHGVDTFPCFLDHVNRIRDDDRIENLRPVTHAENQRNRSWGASRFRYVYRETNVWRARVSTPRGRVNLGRFNTEADAAAAVWQWENTHGDRACHC
jgi:hypothetical protein